MGRRPTTYKAQPAKLRRSITIDVDLDDWVIQQVKVGRRFSSYSHAIQVAVAQLRGRGR